MRRYVVNLHTTHIKGLTWCLRRQGDVRRWPSHCGLSGRSEATSMTQDEAVAQVEFMRNKGGYPKTVMYLAAGERRML